LKVLKSANNETWAVLRKQRASATVSHTHAGDFHIEPQSSSSGNSCTTPS
jgi:hypothetical protein